jgi:transposase insI for insertion sequence element IS30B/C/D
MFFLWNGKKCRRNCAICPACWQRVCRRKDEPAREGFPVSNALSERPAAAQTRERIGDREANTVAGVAGGAVLLTLTDRKSRFLFGVRLEKKTTEGVSAAIIEGLRGQTVHSITPDWGSAERTRTPTVCYGNFPETSEYCAIY